MSKATEAADALAAAMTNLSTSAAEVAAAWTAIAAAMHAQNSKSGGAADDAVPAGSGSADDGPPASSKPGKVGSRAVAPGKGKAKAPAGPSKPDIVAKLKELMADKGEDMVKTLLAEFNDAKTLNDVDEKSYAELLERTQAYIDFVPEEGEAAEEGGGLF